MSTWQLRLGALALVLVALALAIPFLAGYEDYSLYRDGERVTAEIVARDVQGDQVAATLRYRERGVEQEMRVYTSAAAIKGHTVELLLHQNTGVPLLAHWLPEQFPSIWFVLASLVSLALAVLVFRIPNRAAARRARRTSAFEAIVDAAARTRNLSIAVGAMLIVFGAGFAAIPFVDSGSIGATVFIEVLAALSLGLGVMQVRRGYRLRDPRHNELLGLIEQRPHEIAWMYLHEIEVQGGGKTLAIHLWKTDGKLVL